MIISLTGLPGAGKSTFADRLVKDCGFVSVKISSKLGLIWYSLLFFLRYPLFSIRTLFLLFKYNSVSMWYTKFMNTVLHHCARYMKAKQIDKAVIDEGVWHNVISLFDKEVCFGVLQQYIKCIPRVDKVVFFDIPKEVIDVRIKDRGYIVRKGMMKNEKQEEWLVFARIRVAIFAKYCSPIIVREQIDIDGVVAKFS